MKKAHAIITIVFLASAMMLAQTTSTQSGSATDTHAQHHPDTAAPAQSGKAAQGGMQVGNMHGTMSGHMAGMEVDMQQMRTQVDKMRADAQKIKDGDTRAALLENAALWQQFLDRMQHHMQMMRSGMMDQGMGGMHHGADHGCGGASTSSGCQMMEDQKPPVSKTPPPKPQ